MTTTEIIDKIKQLKAEKNAIILAHYYTRPEVQDIADYLGDSLGLSRMAGNTDADLIVFCGVHFMAETASIISPDKKVLIPAKGAGCSLAESVTGYDLLQWKKANPDGLVVSYVNTTAEVKAYTDYCCTSSNALKVVQSLPKDKKILFVPDKNLGAYIQKVTGREMEIWDGDCCVHDKIDAGMVLEKLERHPEADVLIHPESSCSADDRILNHPRAFMYSTAGIIKHAKESPKQQFIIATELETIHKLQQDNPTKEFIPIHPKTICGQMKKVTLESVWEALEKEQFEVRVPDELREKAWLPIQRMLEIG
ncbi:quinolinate synthase NadA [Gabonibacter chumensis]|uniref:quinolinate synthase NadA n=1 Tax=Gabonibacter chumensis TaxID=2972474 RepID=UPI00257364E4|nr:quinolinate synthase NadA [Gabonibacter chumensis]MCR9012062.1 quinolinate synthase NadA [Gabonibacter chumensis]